VVSLLDLALVLRTSSSVSYPRFLGILFRVHWPSTDEYVTKVRRLVTPVSRALPPGMRES